MRSSPALQSYSHDPASYSALEARLRSEHAHLYPYLRADRWEPARSTAEQVLARVLQDPAGAPSSWYRVLDPAHFDFRRDSHGQQSNV
jgi:hypothetical protein